MAINWKPCTKCKEEFLKVEDGLCSACAGRETFKGVQPASPGAIPEKVWKDRRSWDERRQEERREFED